VPRPTELRSDIMAAETQAARFRREMKEGIQFLRENKSVVFLGISWALFLGAMTTGIVVTAPLSDHIFHAGATGYGWLNAGWGVGAFLSALYAPRVIAAVGSRRSIALSMGLLAISAMLAPYSLVLAGAVAVYGVMGSARGVSGVAMNTSLMEQVPDHFMGRVQNIFYFFGTGLQVALGLIVGAAAEKISLAMGFAIIGLVYAMAFVSASWPIQARAATATSAAE
jgi:MFS family permease